MHLIIHNLLAIILYMDNASNAGFQMQISQNWTA